MGNLLPDDRERHLRRLRRQLRRDALPSVTGYIEACPYRYFVTLTTRRPADSFRLSSATGLLLHKLNRSLFREPYKRHKRHRLATLFVHEETYGEQLHAHGLIGIPGPAIRRPAEELIPHLESLIKNMWLCLDDGGEPQAQDIQLITAFEGASRYIQKHVWSADSLDHIDLLNTTLPAIPAV